MAHFQNQYGAVQKTPGYDDPNSPVDEFANPVVKSTDEFGKPVHHTGGGGFHSTGHGAAPAAGTGIGGGHDGHRLHRSGSSSSSSSSEDDGQGGRRKKKGMKGKIKEKLPLGHKDDRSSSAAATTTPGGYNITGDGQITHHEKKGMMEKIKDKLPGHRH